MQLLNMVLAIAPFILLLMLNPVKPDLGLTDLDLENVQKKGLFNTLDDENSTLDSYFDINLVNNGRIPVYRQKLRLSHQLFQHLIEITTFRRNIMNILKEMLDLIDETKSSLENPSKEQQGMSAEAKITDIDVLEDLEVREKVSKEHKKTISGLQTMKMIVYAWGKEVASETEKAFGMTPIIDQFSRSELKATMPSDNENKDESYVDENENQNEDSSEYDANKKSSESFANENDNEEEKLTPDEEWERFLNLTFMEIDDSKRKVLKENSNDDEIERFLKMKLMANNEYELLDDKKIENAVESDIYVENVLSKETEFPRWILTQKDAEQIQREYLQWMEIFERTDIAQIEVLKEAIQESGQSEKQFSKTLAEYSNIKHIIKDCESTRDIECIEIMEEILDQAHFKELDQIYSTWRANAGFASNDEIRF